MSVKFVDGDVFETHADVALAHGCNCAGAMGKGIAVEFKRRWPQMYAVYKEKCLAGEFVCGEVFVWKDETSGRVVFNLGTQKTWRSKATVDAVKTSFQKTINIAEELGSSIICMPMIGAGLGGLEADVVKGLLTELADESPVHVIVCENYIAGSSPMPQS